MEKKYFYIPSEHYQSPQLMRSLLHSHFVDPVYMEFSSDLNEKKWRIKDVNISHRTLNHWLEKGLVDDQREEGKGWNTFSLVDLVWLNIIAELRGHGYSLDKVIELKNWLQQGSESCGADFPLLEINIFKAYHLKQWVHLVLFSGGRPQFFVDEVYLGIHKGIYHHVDSFTCINLHRMIMKAEDAVVETKDIDVSKLAPSDLAKFIEFGGFERVEFKPKNGKSVVVNRTERLDTDTKLNDLLKEGVYQEITLTHDGKRTVSLKRNIRDKYEAE